MMALPRSLRLNLLAACAVALLLRLGTAVLLPHLKPPVYSHAFYFPDSEIYWKLALRMARGESYSDGARRVVRSPGYPAFLALSIRLLGPHPDRARAVQAMLGTIACVLLYLAWQILFGERLALRGLWLVALYPPAVLLSVLLLSEALFILWLAAQLWCGLVLWQAIQRHDWYVPGRHERGTVAAAALGTGIAAGLAVLTRPVWLPVPVLFVALLLGALARARRRSGQSLRVHDAAALAVVLLAFVLVCAPWWIRNRLVTGHWVLGSLWLGASLYDGLNPHATGASDMSFLIEPERFGLDPHRLASSEYEQDVYLRREAFRFVLENPLRALELALLKQRRFWSLVPQAPGWQHPLLRWSAAVLWACLYTALLIGAWRLRPVGRWFLWLLGPLGYTALVHTIFVGSIRYREPVLLPALVLAAAAWTERTWHQRKP